MGKGRKRKHQRKSPMEGTPPNQRSIRSWFKTSRDGVQEPRRANSQGAAAAARPSSRSDLAPENRSSFAPRGGRPLFEKATNSKATARAPFLVRKGLTAPASARGELKSSTQSAVARAHEAAFEQQEDQASKKRGREEAESENNKKKKKKKKKNNNNNKKIAGLHSREEIQFLAQLLLYLGYGEDDIVHEMHLGIKRGELLLHSDMVLVVGGKRFCVEFDGEYWHNQDNRAEKDVEKTMRVLQFDPEVHVIRVRQGDLPRLPALESLDRCTILASRQKKTSELAHQTCAFIRKYILFTTRIHPLHGSNIYLYFRSFLKQ